MEPFSPLDKFSRKVMLRADKVLAYTEDVVYNYSDPACSKSKECKLCS